jgi:hypothetical protein
MEELVARFCARQLADRGVTTARLARALADAPPAALFHAHVAIAAADGAATLVAELAAATDPEYLSSPAPRLSGALALLAQLAGGGGVRAASGRRAPLATHIAAAEARLAFREAGACALLPLLLEAVDPLARLHAYAAAQHLAADAGAAVALASGPALRSLERAAADDAGAPLALAAAARAAALFAPPTADSLRVWTAAYAAGALANVLAHSQSACARARVPPPRVRAAARAAAARRLAEAAAADAASAANRVCAAARGRAARRRAAALRAAREPVARTALGDAQRAHAARAVIAIVAELVADEAAAVAAGAVAGADAAAARGRRPSLLARAASAAAAERQAILDAKLGRVLELDALRAALTAADAPAPPPRAAGGAGGAPVAVREMHTTIVRGFQRLRLLAAVLIQAHARGAAARARVFREFDEIVTARAAHRGRRAAAATRIASVARGVAPRRALAAHCADVAARAEAEARDVVARCALRAAARDTSAEALALGDGDGNFALRCRLEAEAFWLDAGPFLDPKRLLRTRARERRAATTLQAHARRRAARKRLCHARALRRGQQLDAAATTLQAAVRGMGARARVAAMRAERFRHRKHAAACCIQRAQRRRRERAQHARARRRALAELSRQRRRQAAVLRLQAAWRGARGRERARLYARYVLKSGAHIRSPAQIHRARRLRIREAQAAHAEGVRLRAHALHAHAGGGGTALAVSAAAGAPRSRTASAAPSVSGRSALALDAPMSKATLARRSLVDNRASASRALGARYVLEMRQAIAAAVLQAQHRMRVTRRAYLDARNRARANEALRALALAGELRGAARTSSLAAPSFPGAKHVRLRNNQVLRDGALLVFHPGAPNQETRRNCGIGYVLVDKPLQLAHLEDELVVQVRQGGGRCGSGGWGRW